MPFKCPCTAHVFFPELLSNHCQGLRRTFSEIYTKFVTVPLSDPSRNRIRPDTRLQTIGRKYQYVDITTFLYLEQLLKSVSYNHYKCGRGRLTTLRWPGDLWSRSADGAATWRLLGVLLSLSLARWGVLFS
jgi:hypothetical protein